MTEEREQRARNLWCLWGTLMCAMPCTLRSSATFLFNAASLVAPLQYQVEFLAIALSLLVLVWTILGSRRLDRFVLIVRMASPVIAFTCIPVIALCEAGWLPMRLGDYSLLERQPLFEALGGVALVLSLVFWALNGSLLRTGGELPDASGKRGLMLTLLILSVCFPLVIGVVSLLLPAWSGPLLCVMSGVMSWCVLRRITDGRFTSTELVTCELVIIGGLFASSASGRVFSEILTFHPANFSDVNTQTSVLIVAVFLVFVALVLALIAAYAYWVAQDGMESFTSDAVPRDDRPSVFLSHLPGADSLSARQRDVIALRLKGMKGAEIADRLGIARGTVSTFQRRALDALGFESLDQLSSRLEAAREVNDSSGRPSRGRMRLNSLLEKFFSGLLILLPLTVGVPTPYQESALLVAGALLIVVALTQMTMVGTGLWGSVAVRTGDRGCALTCICAQLLGCYTSVNYGGFPLGIINVALSELGLGVSALREGLVLEPKFSFVLKAYWSRLVASLSQGMRTICSHRHAFLLLVGSGLSFRRAALLNTSLQEVFFIGIVLTIGLSIVDAVRISRERQLDARETPVERNRKTVEVLSDLGLTETEARVLTLASLGMSRSQIANQLYIAPGTVNGAKATAYRKLNIHSASELKALLEKHAG